MKTTRLGAIATLVLSVLIALPQAADAQYFGRNKVQYDDFDFRVLETPHFDIHYYPAMSEAIEDVARMSERWYERFARTFQHEFEASKPLIFYADHPDFQQTNTLQGFIGEGTGGVTESLKNRVIMPLTGSYWDTDHVLGHELVHAFQYNIAQARQGGGLQGLYSLPLWLIEGMAEYMSVGRDDPLTAMWMRDAIRRDDFPTIRQMTREARFFPYRFGQGLWAYIGGTYGDDAVVGVFRRSLRIGFAGAIQQVLGVSPDTLSAQWEETVRAAYQPLMAGREEPDSVGTVILDSDNAGNQNVSPSLSPDGSRVAFLSEKDLFSVDLYLADFETGRIIRKLSNSISDPHSDALRYIDSSGTWSPDGSRFAYVVFAGGDNELVVVNARNGDVEQRLELEGVGSINNPAWSPDGERLAFAGMVGGLSDLYVYDLESGELTQLTDDKYADFHPTWSPDGTTLAFATDRGPETDFDQLTFSKFRIALIDVASGGIQTLPLLGDVRHSNPQFSPDGGSLYFISDADGFSDVYRTDLSNGAVYRVTRVATGVSGIVPMSPALSVAAESGDIAISVFSDFGFTIHRLPANTPGRPLTYVAQGPQPGPGPGPGRALPPGQPSRFNLVAGYLDDPMTGLDLPGTYQVEDAEDYSSSLALDYIGQPSVGAGVDAFGSYVGGSASAYFSDMLGNRILGVGVLAQGTVKDIGGAVTYADLGDRWNWAAGASRFPYQFVGYGIEENDIPDDVDYALVWRRYRIFQTTASGQVSYPFSMTRRLEGGLGFTRYSYDVEEDRVYYRGVFPVGADRVDRPELEPDPINLLQASAALVGDNSFFGFVSPIRGGRYRIGLEYDYELAPPAAAGSRLKFLTGIADWRRYWAPHRNLTLGLRTLHYGRYGDVERTGALQSPVRRLFLGFETFIRGYAWESFENRECAVQNINDNPIIGGSEELGCPVYDRLFGHRIGVVNLEARLPLIGTEQFGIINFGFLPTELSFFVDAGLAWNSWSSSTGPDLKFVTGDDARTSGRVPVVSTGASARFNILGFLILEAYYAYPFQRPDKGWHWGFNIAPGW